MARPYLVASLGATFVGIFLLLVLFDIYQVASRSMEPAIPQGSYVVVNRYHYSFFRPKRGDVAAFLPTEAFPVGPWVHRVVGVPGDTVTLTEDRLLVNGSEIEFPAVNPREEDGALLGNGSITLGNGEIFQKGDNATTLFGIVSGREIIGKVIATF